MQFGQLLLQAILTLVHPCTYFLGRGETSIPTINLR